MSYIFIIISYLVGSIPFGLLLTKYSGNGDIRTIGSGNIGATNVLRTGNKFLAFATLLLDGLKGVVMIIIAKKMGFSLDVIYFAAFFSVIGHVFPVWLKFQGGKGVATTVAVILALNMYLGAFFVIIWLVMFSLTKISSLSSIVASICLPIISFVVFLDMKLSLLCFLLALIVIAKHKQNISRLVKGEEKRLNI